jgi:glycosyltransferase involved in cell wall biosynthesis
MADPPQLTVAIPTFNGARHLADTLWSILPQKGVTFDLIISDDRSHDGTLSLVRAETGDRARIVVNSERLGLAGNWNRCVALSRTPLVAIFHQDDIMRPGHLAAHVAAFASDPRIGLVASAADVIDDEGEAIPETVIERGGLGPSDQVFEPGAAIKSMAIANPLRCSAVTLRAEAHADVGGFDPSYRYVVDWDAWLRISRRWSLAWLARPSVAIRWHSASETHLFKTGTTDLDESIQLFNAIFAQHASEWPDAPRLHRDGGLRIGRAYMNRFHDALQAGDVKLARACLARAKKIQSILLKTLLTDPKLAAEVAALCVAPRTAARWFAKRLRP